MIKIAQFGEGGFLRTFVDYYFDNLNKEGKEYSVSIIKPIPFGTLDRFHEQDNKYNVILRGMEDGKEVETVYKVTCVDKVIDPFNEIDEYAHYVNDDKQYYCCEECVKKAIYKQNFKGNIWEIRFCPAYDYCKQLNNLRKMCKCC